MKNYSLMRKNVKLTARFFVLCAFLSLSAHSAWAQTARGITLNFSNTELKTILLEVQRQTGTNFVYDNREETSFPRLTIRVSNEPLNGTLDKLFANTSFTWVQRGNSIGIVRRTAEPTGESQLATVGGVVRDVNGRPLIGVTVVIIGTGRGVSTDADGRYKIAIRKGETLAFSYIGKKTQEMAWSGQATLDVRLEDAAARIDDVVVTGIFRKSAESFTGSVVTVTAAELDQYGSRNVLASLRNIDPSFNIIENNLYGSDPNKLPDVQIRGSSSIPNVDELQDETRTGLNTPLVIMDGFESSLQTLLDMNENEISTITILKDASATAMYGSRGANGVIVIETKIPIKGKLKVSYRGNLNLEMPDLSSYNLMTAREKLNFEYLVGVYSTEDSYSYLSRQQYNYLLSQVESGVDTYWLSKPLRVGTGQRHNLRLEGGDDVFRYSVSTQYNKIVGIMKGSGRDNFNGTINLSYSYKSLRFSNSTVIGLNNTKESPYGTFSEYARMNPYFATHNNGKLIKTLGLDGEGASSRWGAAGIANPLWNSTLNTYDKTNTTTITNNFAIDWNILEGLILRGKLGLTKSIGGSDAFYPAEHTKFKDYAQADLLRRGKYINGNNRSNSIDAALTANYSHVFAQKHHIYAGLNLNARQNQSSSTSITAEGFVNDDLDILSMALQYEQGGKPSGTESKSRSIGIVGNFNYSFDNRYYVDFTVTSDGNSAFGADKRFATFWSAGFGWNIHNESFFKGSEAVDRLKIRGSVGTNGSQSFSSYQALTTYKYFTDSRYFTWLGADVNKLGNPDLKWQQKMNYNMGFEADLLSRRLQLVFDVYMETTRDQISSITVPSSTGFSSYIENIGKVENKGFELKLTGILVRNSEKRIMWSVTGSIVHNKNTIKKLSEALIEAQASLETDTGSNPNMIYREGYSMDAIWVVPSLGIDPSTGKELFRDRFGNPTWTWNASDLAACGISQPKYQGNINTNFRWRNFQLTASFGYRMGGQIYNSTLIDKVENVNYTYNLDKRVSGDRWQYPGDSALFKSVSVTEKTKKTSRFVQDERTFRCQSISITYDFDRDLVKKWKMSNLSLQVSMDDLFYLSSVKRERGTSYPFSRQLSFSLNMMF